LLLVVLAAILWAAASAGAQPAPSDPVKQLREALRGDPDSDRSEAAQASRDNNVKLRADALTRLSDLARALLLAEWYDYDEDDGGRAVDREVRRKLATRFRSSVQDILRKGDPLRRAAAATVVGEIVTNAHARDLQSVSVWEMLAELAPDLARATADADPAVRETAAVALSKIDARTKPKDRLVAVVVAVPAYKKMLALPDAASRRVAAAALGELIRTLDTSGWRGVAPRRGQQASQGATFYEFLELGQAIVPLLAGSLRDADAEVRRHSLETLRQAALTLADSVEQSVRSRERLDDTAPLVKALKERMPAVAAALDEEAAIIAACAALEAIADARHRLVRRAAGIACSPEEKKGKGKQDLPFTEVLGPELKQAAPALTKPLASKRGIGGASRWPRPLSRAVTIRAESSSTA
jgi:hypothetical protein